nr:hypothetical protein Iba_chr02dCG11040 [Ipomoea batatas]
MQIQALGIGMQQLWSRQLLVDDLGQCHHQVTENLLSFVLLIANVPPEMFHFNALLKPLIRSTFRTGHCLCHFFT